METGTALGLLVGGAVLLLSVAPARAAQFDSQGNYVPPAPAPGGNFNPLNWFGGGGGSSLASQIFGGANQGGGAGANGGGGGFYNPLLPNYSPDLSYMPAGGFSPANYNQGGYTPIDYSGTTAAYSPAATNYGGFYNPGLGENISYGIQEQGAGTYAGAYGYAGGYGGESMFADYSSPVTPPGGYNLANDTGGYQPNLDSFRFA